MENLKNTPTLRFPEFTEEWEEKSIDSGIDLLSGFPFGGEDISDNKEGIKLMRGVNISEGFIRHSDEIDRYFCGDFSKLQKYLLKENDLVIGMDGSKVGKNSALIDIDNSNSLLIQRVARLRPLKNFCIKFIYQHINSVYFTSYADKVKTSSGIPHISNQQIKDFKIFFPIYKEQTRIAQFLSTVDTKIQQLTKKKTLLEKYKKGVMQKIFNQEIRFKDDNGNDFPDWEEKCLGEVAKIYDGTHFTPNYVDEGIPFYSVEQVTANNFSKTKFITQEVFEKENERVKLEKGDILMTKIGDIGTSKYIDWDVEASFYVSLALIKQSKLYNSKFLNQYIKSVQFQQELHKKIIHVAFPKKINLGEIGNCLVVLPCLTEQQKIATFLSSLDKKIEFVNTQLEKSKLWKKGLLQEMFV